MPCGSDAGDGRSYSAISPVAVMRPTRLAPHSVNQQSPAEAAAMAWGLAVRSGSGNSSISPSVEILPIWPAPISTNHRAVAVAGDADRGGAGGGQRVNGDVAVDA